MKKLIFSSMIDASQEEIFAYHESPAALARLVAPFENCRLVHKDDGLSAGVKAHLQMKVGPFKIDWISEHTKCEKPALFEDQQTKGPFSYFKHTHIFNKVEENKTEMIDEIAFSPPFGIIGKIFLTKLIAKRLTKLFNYRHKVVQEDFFQESLTKEQSRKRVLISGANGFVGSYVSMMLKLFNHEVVSLSRKQAEHRGEVFWDPETSKINQEELEGFDAVIHLSGENVGSSFWTKKKKKRIYESRINSTRFLVKSLSSLKNPPKKLLVASAYGYYGLDREKVLTESSERGEGFLADVCSDWEKEAMKYSEGMVSSLRFGVILGVKSGMLKKILPIFKVCLGAVMGKKERYMSWISIEDVMYQIYHLVGSDVRGPVNFVSSYCTNKEFAKTFAKVLHRGLFLTLPEALIKLLFGEMANSLFLSSLKVEPKALKESNAHFSYKDLESALSQQLGIFRK